MNSLKKNAGLTLAASCGFLTRAASKAIAYQLQLFGHACFLSFIIKDSCKNNFRFWRTLALTPALSHLMGEGEWSSVSRRIQPLWKLRETGQAVPSPVGRERVRVRVVLLEIRLLSGSCFCTNPMALQARVA